MKNQILTILKNTHKDNLIPEVVLCRKLGLDSMCYIENNEEQKKRFDEYKKVMRLLKQNHFIKEYEIRNGKGYCLI